MLVLTLSQFEPDPDQCKTLALEAAQAGETIADVVNWVKDSIRETRKAWKCDPELGRLYLG